jgi:hypothetical protein
MEVLVMSEQKQKKPSLLSIMQEELGFETKDAMLEDYALEGVVPGICRSCHTVEDCCEPDATANYCNECGENRVVSVLVLAGLC